MSKWARSVIVCSMFAASTTLAQQPLSDQAQPSETRSVAPVPELPPVTVTTPPEERAPKPGVQKPQRASGEARSPNARPTNDAGQASGSGGAGSSAEATKVVNEGKALDAARENILPKIGVNSYQLDQATIQELPQGNNASLDKVLLQTPGIYQDSAASGNLHIRNEHANLQYRIDGIQLPDGVSGFGQVLETSLIGNLNVVTGALPAQYGLRTAGLVDIQTRTPPAVPGGQIDVYGGSHGTFTTNLQYGGVSGDTEYFFTGRFLETNLGIENPTPSVSAIHDQSQQEKFFGYMSTVLPDNARWTVITGASVGHYQIPDNPGQQNVVQSGVSPFATLPSALGTTNYNSANLNEQQLEQNYFGVLAFQQTVGAVDYQLSYFTRYSSLHFTPDLFGDIAFNGLATDVTRHSFLSGIQTDGAWRVSADHTLRGGIVVSGEQTYVTDGVVAIDSTTNGLDSFADRESKLGWIAGVYIQDEWKITDKLTINSGLRFDQMWQYVDANQLSPRIAAVYKPMDGTVFHAGYARAFTPPPQAVGAPENYALFNNTVAASQIGTATPGALPVAISPALPERANVFDIGVTQVLARGLDAGLAAYYKTAKDLIDDGQFGQAYTLTAFNYARGENEGLELKIKYSNDGVLVYGNLAWARQVATQIVSNQYLFDAAFYQYALTNYIPTDHSQTLSASAGVSYPVWDHTKASLDMIYGSGLRSGDFNQTHVPGYTQFNLGLSHEFILPDWSPFTLRFDVVNLFDHIYEIRDGTGVGVFAPQYGPRRGFFVGLSQKF